MKCHLRRFQFLLSALGPRPAVTLQLVRQRHAVNIEHVGRPALVRTAVFQFPKKVNAFDFIFIQALTLLGPFPFGCWKMKSCSRNSGSWTTTMARSTAFSSSRTFPIHVAAATDSSRRVRCEKRVYS